MKVSTEVKNVMQSMIDAEGAILGFSECKEYLIELSEILRVSDDVNFDFDGVTYRLINESVIDEIYSEELLDLITANHNLAALPDFIVIDWESTISELKISTDLGDHFCCCGDSEYTTAGEWFIFRLGA